jgi:hypothetical protein
VQVHIVIIPCDFCMTICVQAVSRFFDQVMQAVLKHLNFNGNVCTISVDDAAQPSHFSVFECNCLSSHC